MLCVCVQVQLQRQTDNMEMKPNYEQVKQTKTFKIQNFSRKLENNFWLRQTVNLCANNLNFYQMATFVVEFEFKLPVRESKNKAKQNKYDDETIICELAGSESNNFEITNLHNNTNEL